MPGCPAMGLAADLLPGPRLALVVATQTYNDPGLRQLRAPARDADDLTNVLADPGIGGFAVTTVIDQPAHQVRLAVEDFLDGRGTQDLLLVYLSCHGLLDARRRLYFAATDTRKDRLGSTGVEAAWILDQLEHCRARRQVLILDSCFSGAFAHGAKGEADLALQDRFLGQGRGRVVLTASTATEYSFEGDLTDAAIPAGSVFTAALVQGLRTGAADTDHDGHVSVDDAYAYVYDQVQAAGAAQTPQRWLYGAEGQILLARNPAGPSPAVIPRATGTGAEPPAPTAAHGQATTQILGAYIFANTLTGHSSRWVDRLGRTVAVNSVAFSPDGQLLASASDDQTVRLWDPATGAHRRTLTGHDQPVSGVAFSPDGRLLASASRTGSVRLWDPATGAHRRTLTGHADPVRGVAFSPDGRLLASASDDQTVRLWDPATGAHLRTLTGHADPVRGVAFSPDGRLLASASDDQTVRLWDPATGAHLRTLTGHADPVRGVAFSPDGRLLASASDDQTVRLWDPATGAHRRTLTGHDQPVSGVAFSPDGRLLASASDDQTVRLWDPATGAHRRTLTGHDQPVSGVAFSPDGRLLASASDDKTVRLWDLTSADR